MMRKAGNVFCAPLGDGSAGNPLEVYELVSGTSVAKLSHAGSHSAVISLDGMLMVWGANDVGQLGNGAAGPPVDHPTFLFLSRQPQSAELRVCQTESSVADDGGERVALANVFCGPAQIAFVEADEQRLAPSTSASSLADSDGPVLQSSRHPVLQYPTAHVGTRLHMAGMLPGGQVSRPRFEFCCKELMTALGVLFDPEHIHVRDVAFTTSVCIVVIECSPSSSCVVSFGSSPKGHLGLGVVTNQQSPAPIVALAKHKITMVSASDVSVAVLTEQGQVFVWGEYNQSNQLKSVCYTDPLLIQCDKAISVFCGSGFVTILSVWVRGQRGECSFVQGIARMRDFEETQDSRHIGEPAGGDRDECVPASLLCTAVFDVPAMPPVDDECANENCAEETSANAITQHHRKH